MFVRDIPSERDLFTWLMTYMQRGKKRRYPEPVLVLTHAIIKNIPHGLTRDFIAEGQDAAYGESKCTSVLGAMFDQLCDDKDADECSERIVHVAATVYDHLGHGRFMSCRTANRRHLRAWPMKLPLRTPKREYFVDVDKGDGFTCLEGTPLLAQEHGIAVMLPNKRSKRT